MRNESYDGPPNETTNYFRLLNLPDRPIRPSADDPVSCDCNNAEDCDLSPHELSYWAKLEQVKRRARDSEWDWARTDEQLYYAWCEITALQTPNGRWAHDATDLGDLFLETLIKMFPAIRVEAAAQRAEMLAARNSCLALYDKGDEGAETDGIIGNNIFRPGTIALCGGEGGAGKSTLAQEMTRLIASGLPVGNLKTRAVPTVFLSEELSEGQFQGRLQKNTTHEEVVAAARWKHLCRSGARIRTHEERVALRYKLESLGATNGHVWAENLVNLAVGVDEDDNALVGEILNGVIVDIAQPLNCQITINDHTGHGADRPRGASCKGDIPVDVIMVSKLGKDVGGSRCDRLISFTKTNFEDERPPDLRFVRYRRDGLFGFRFEDARFKVVAPLDGDGETADEEPPIHDVVLDLIAKSMPSGMSGNAVYGAVGGRKTAVLAVLNDLNVMGKIARHDKVWRIRQD